jgi:hypothetical protein
MSVHIFNGMKKFYNSGNPNDRGQPSLTRQNGFFPQQLPGPAQPACAGVLPQQEVSPDPGSPCLATPDREEGAESSFFRFTLPQALQVGVSLAEAASTSLVAPHSVHKNSKIGMSFFTSLL